MKKSKKMMALILVLALSLSMSMTAFAANKKQTILDAMTAAATELGVQNSARFQNVYNSVANYEGIITDEQLEAALSEIQYVKNAIAAEGVDAVSKYSDSDAFVQELIAHLTAAAEAVGVTIRYDGNGAVTVTSNVSSPIKQTGVDYTATALMVLAVAVIFGGCIFIARKKQLYA